MAVLCRYCGSPKKEGRIAKLTHAKLMGIASDHIMMFLYTGPTFMSDEHTALCTHVYMHVVIIQV